MASVIIKNEKNDVILNSTLERITPLAVECAISEEEIKGLRDKSGRFIPLYCELYLETDSEPVCINGKVSVASIRKVSQDVNLLKAKFIELEQGAYQYIAEYVNYGRVVSVSLAHSAAKRRA